MRSTAVARPGLVAVVLLALLLAGVSSVPPATSVGSPSGASEPASRIALVPLMGPNYSVTLSEVGLPAGTNWSVVLNGSTAWSTTANIAFSVPNGTYAYGVDAVAGWVASPRAGNVSVAGGAVTQNVTFTPFTFSLTFTEAGLPAGTAWQVVVNGTAHNSTTASIVVPEPNGSYAYTVSSVANYSVSPRTGTAVIANGSTTTPITFTLILYDITFDESGLPSATFWSVHLPGSTISSNASAIVFLQPNGSYSFSLGAVSGYTAAPSSGTVNVTGASVQQDVVFTTVPPNQYVVEFNETGLAVGTNWSAAVNGTQRSASGSTIDFTLVNGSYNYTIGALGGYRAAPNSGTVSVTGAPVSVAIAFTVVRYSINFTESGLPGATHWSFVVGGILRQGNTSWIVVALANGSHPLAVTPIPGYLASPSGGFVNVSGGPMHFSITFTRVTYAVTWQESGLPVGTNWSVTLGGQSSSSTTPQLSFNEPNGSYGFQVGAIAGYVVLPASGTVLVNGTSLQETVTFTTFLLGVSFFESGLAAGTSWSVQIASQHLSSSGSSISLLLSNGSYGYTVGQVRGFTASPSSGTVTVAGANQSVSVVFTALPPGSFPVSFSERGLPVGTSWNVSLNGTGQSATGSVITFVEANGSYPFTVAPLGGFNATPSGGTVLVNGSSTNETITFHTVPAPVFAVTFDERGLPAGAAWSVSFAGMNLSTANVSVAFTARNGIYPYTVMARGYSASPSAADVTVSGQPVVVLVTFSPTAGGASPASVLRIPTVLYMAAMGGMIAVAIGIALGTREGRPTDVRADDAR